MIDDYKFNPHSFVLGAIYMLVIVITIKLLI